MSQKPTFTVIHSPRRRSINEHLFPSPIQAELFSEHAPNTVVFVTLAKISDEDFIKTLDFSKPALIVDIRRFPRFDIGSLTRLKVFEQFAKRNIEYTDLGSGIGSRHPVFDSPYLEHLEPKRHLHGTVMVLLDDRTDTPEIEKRFIDFAYKATREYWAIVHVPCFLPNTVSSGLKTG
jgi:hypothetical protein